MADKRLAVREDDVGGRWFSVASGCHSEVEVEVLDRG
jgi:hypothetical protein